MKEPKLPVNVDRQLADLTKNRIQAEITNLERQLERLSIDSDTVDFALLETYKEMIHARRELMSSLPVSF